VEAQSKNKEGVIFLRKKFDCSVDQQVDRIIFGTKTMRQSMEEIIMSHIAQVKAMEIYGTHSAPMELEPAPEPKVLRLRSGEDLSAEEQANEILVNSRRQEGKNADRREWLTTEQILLRQHKEVYNQNGFPDAALVSGMYKRVHNPLAGNRPGRNSKSEE
jgi:hypothetical protein